MSTPVIDAWYHDRTARRFLLLGYVPWIAGLSLAWEIAHLPLYTIWTEASWMYIAFAVAHCTAGDVFIGTACLALTLVAARQGPLRGWAWRRIALGTAIFGVSYTAFSEWVNVAVLQSWAYSNHMPVIELAAVRLGASPLLQWVVIPPLALYAARRRAVAEMRAIL